MNKFLKTLFAKSAGQTAVVEFHRLLARIDAELQKPANIHAHVEKLKAAWQSTHNKLHETFAFDDFQKAVTARIAWEDANRVFLDFYPQPLGPVVDTDQAMTIFRDVLAFAGNRIREEVKLLAAEDSSRCERLGLLYEQSAAVTDLAAKAMELTEAAANIQARIDTERDRREPQTAYIRHSALIEFVREHFPPPKS